MPASSIFCSAAVQSAAAGGAVVGDLVSEGPWVFAVLDDGVASSVFEANVEDVT